VITYSPHHGAVVAGLERRASVAAAGRAHRLGGDRRDPREHVRESEPVEELPHLREERRRLGQRFVERANDRGPANLSREVGEGPVHQIQRDEPDGDQRREDRDGRSAEGIGPAVLRGAGTRAEPGADEPPDAVPDSGEHDERDDRERRLRHRLIRDPGDERHEERADDEPDQQSAEAKRLQREPAPEPRQGRQHQCADEDEVEAVHDVSSSHARPAGSVVCAATLRTSW
jgi:hypothetical protein